MIGSFLGGRTTSEESSTDVAERMQELEAENKQQAELIKNLQSEMMKLQVSFKDQAYNAHLQIQELTKEREAVEVKNANLIRELDLARKLESFAAQQDGE